MLCSSTQHAARALVKAQSDGDLVSGVITPRPAGEQSGNRRHMERLGPMHGLQAHLGVVHVLRWGGAAGAAVGHGARAGIWGQRRHSEDFPRTRTSMGTRMRMKTRTGRGLGHALRCALGNTAAPRGLSLEGAEAWLPLTGSCKARGRQEAREPSSGARGTRLTEQASSEGGGVEGGLSLRGLHLVSTSRTWGAGKAVLWQPKPEAEAALGLRLWRRKTGPRKTESAHSGHVLWEQRTEPVTRGPASSGAVPGGPQVSGDESAPTH